MASKMPPLPVARTRAAERPPPQATNAAMALSPLPQLQALEEDKEKGQFSHRSAASDGNARVQLENGHFADLRTKAEKMHLTEKVAEKKMGVTVEELHVDKAMQILGTKYSRWVEDKEKEKGEEQEGGSSFKPSHNPHGELPAMVNEKVYPTKALKTFGVTYDDMVRHKALKVLGVTEEEVANAYRGNLAFQHNSGIARFLPSNIFRSAIHNSGSIEATLPAHPPTDFLGRKASLRAMRTSQRTSLLAQPQGRLGFGRAHVHPEGTKQNARPSKRQVSQQVRNSQRRQSRWTMDAETIDGDEHPRIIF